jgi:hypothetical protein
MRERRRERAHRHRRLRAAPIGRNHAQLLSRSSHMILHGVGGRFAPESDRQSAWNRRGGATKTPTGAVF